MSMHFDTKQPITTPPVLFIIFSRPETTRLTFEAIRQAKPSRLFVAADGPRANRPGEAEKCAETRAIISGVDWDCEVKTLFRDHNLGCGRGPADAIHWFFSHVEDGIILEDDILPSQDFFRFCGEMLQRYRDDVRVMQVGGINWLAKHPTTHGYSYRFSRFCETWGWATWRRAWKLYDFEIKSYGEVREGDYFGNCFGSVFQEDHFRRIFDSTYGHTNEIDWWDYQWEYAMRVNAGLSIIPNKNLIRNIGLGQGATHTTHTEGRGADLKHEPLSFPLKHPPFVVPAFKEDEELFNGMWVTYKTRLKRLARYVSPHIFSGKPR